MGLQTAFNLVDAYIIARLPSDVSGPSLGAIGICDQLAALGTIISYGISVAAASMVSRAWGRGDKDEARRIAWQSGLLVLGLGIVLALVGGLGARTLLTSVIGVKGQVAERGADYLSVVMGGGVTMFLMLHCASLLRAVGSAKTPVFLLLLGNVINFFFAVLFVYGTGVAPEFLAWGPVAARALGIPRLELFGAGVATLLARAVVLLPLAFFAAKRLGFVSRATALVPDRAMIVQVLRLAWPSSAELVVRMCAMLLTHALVARAFTTATDQSATTALGIVFRFETMALFISIGWGSAVQTFVGTKPGRGSAYARQAERLLGRAVQLGHDGVALDHLRGFRRVDRRLLRSQRAGAGDRPELLRCGSRPATWRWASASCSARSCKAPVSERALLLDGCVLLAVQAAGQRLGVLLGRPQP